MVLINLSRNEKRIIKLLFEGNDELAIIGILKWKYSTVNKIKKDLYVKLKVTNNTDLCNEFHRLKKMGVLND